MRCATARVVPCIAASLVVLMSGTTQAQSGNAIDRLRVAEIADWGCGLGQLGPKTR
jgi:hypothetical protein